jgi:hypothetical protein
MLLATTERPQVFHGTRANLPSGTIWSQRLQLPSLKPTSIPASASPRPAACESKISLRTSNSPLPSSTRRQQALRHRHPFLRPWMKRCSNMNPQKRFPAARMKRVGLPGSMSWLNRASGPRADMAGTLDPAQAQCARSTHLDACADAETRHDP